MAIDHKPAKEAHCAALEGIQDMVNADGHAFSESFLGLQALEGTVTHEQLVGVQLLAEQVAGQPIRGIRTPFYFFLGEHEPQAVHARPAPKLSFFGILRGLETVTPPAESEKDDLLCLVVDPLTTSDLPIIRDSSYHRQRGWRTYLYQSGGVAYAEQRLWVPASGISEVTIDTGYIREAILDIAHAGSQDQVTEVVKQFSLQPTGEAPALSI
jgi:hypothetical protein